MGSKFKSRAERYRERAAELLAKVEDFQDPANSLTVKMLAEDYLAVAERLDRFTHDLKKPT